MSYTPAQLLLGRFLRCGRLDDEAFASLQEYFPKHTDIPTCDATTRAVYEVLYRGGLCDLAALDTRTGGVYHDYVAPLAGGEAVELAPKVLIGELVRERDRQALLIQVSRAQSELAAGGVSPFVVADSLAEALGKIDNPERPPTWVEYLVSSRKAYEDQIKHGAELTTGLRALDGIFMFRRNQMVIDAAPTSHGKTSFATMLANRGAAAGLRVAMLCFEDYNTLPLKIASQRYGKPLQWFTRYDLATEPQRVEVDTALLELREEKNISIYPPMRLSQFAAEIRGTKPDIIILDYVQRYVECYGGENKREACGKAASDFQSLVQQHDAFGLLCSQIRRRELSGSGKPRRPHLSDLKESGDLENYADAVLMLWWPWKDTLSDTNLDREKYHIEIAKDKLGECGDIEVRFDPTTLTWRDKYQAV